jgi:gas vesicle protein
VAAAVIALIGVIAGALVGAVGGYLTARQQGRQALELAKANAVNERDQQLRDLALEITKVELARSPDNPHMAAEHVAVLMEQLNRLRT